MTKACTLPPRGWICTRGAGHEGPCAAWMVAMTVDNTWIDNVPPETSDYWKQVRFVAGQVKADGCTGVSDIFLDSCLEHDIHWRLGTTIYQVPITTAQANRRFRKVIQSRSLLGRFSPVSWVRWVGVTVGARVLSHRSL